jgi:alpha/beta superfamily hydrolase
LVPLALAGFSFGAFVTCQAPWRAGRSADGQKIVLVGTAASRFDVPPCRPSP